MVRHQGLAEGLAKGFEQSFFFIFEWKNIKLKKPKNVK
jgi:hypothetical protein